MFRTRNVLYQLPHELPNDIRLRILGKKEILGKSLNYLGTQSTVQFVLQIKVFGLQKPCKSRFQIFSAFSNFAWFLNFPQNILQKLVSNVQPSFFPNLLRARRELTLETETKTKGIFEAVLSYIQGTRTSVLFFSNIYIKILFKGYFLQIWYLSLLATWA